MQSAHLPRALYRADQVRELDRIAISEAGIPGIQLMKRAGRAVFEALLAQWPEVDAITVFCGVGNNAGDGYVVAALAAQRRIPVQVIQVGDSTKLAGDALQAYKFARQEGVIMAPLSESPAFDQGVMVDALLGTGMSGLVREPYAQAINMINLSHCPVIAADIPSGLCCNTGRELGFAVRADITVSFIGLKRGLLTARGPALTGTLLFDDLGVSATTVPGVHKVLADCERLELLDTRAYLPERQADDHKGRHGHVMVIGGDLGLGGAASMAAEAAVRIGSGLVSVATQPIHVAPILARRPELMVQGVISGQEVEPLLSRPTVMVVGPGLGQSPWSEQMLQQVLNVSKERDIPVVLDADALNLMTGKSLWDGKPRDNWILTPHPGEAARLLDCSTEEVQADRFAAVEQLRHKFGGCVLIKGAGTIISSSVGEVSLAAVGNPGMASGGMGDVLSGVLGGLVAQGLELGQATRLGVCLHGCAGDQAVQDGGMIGLLATDLLPYLRELLNQDPGH